jgi:hypothetical protein
MDTKKHYGRGMHDRIRIHVMWVSMIAALLIVYGTVPSCLAQTPCNMTAFAVESTFPPGGFYTRPVKTGDFNSDGKLDLIVSHSSTSNLMILLGDGSGDFTITYSMPRLGIIDNLELADLNKDGHLDIIAGNVTDRHFGIAFGNGDGTFSDMQRIMVNPNNPNAMTNPIVAVGDFDNDGNLDIIAIHGWLNSLSIFFGDGTGALSDPVVFSGIEASRCIAVGYFNDDDYLDFVTANWHPSHCISVFLNNGDGSFATPVTYPEYYTGYVITGDWNDDGFDDLAISGAGVYSIRYNDGQGGFTSRSTFTGGIGAYAGIATGDFNRDTYPDLVFCNNWGSSNSTTYATITLLNGSFNGTFTMGATLDAGMNPHSVTTGDFDGDGNIDIAVTGQYSSTLMIYLGDGSGFTLHSTVDFGAIESHTTPVIHDYDEDGYLDILTANARSGNLSFYRGMGNGDFMRPVQTSFTYGGWSAYFASAELCDLNGDGYADLIIPQPVRDSVLVVFGNGQGDFLNPMRILVGSYPISVTVGDFDNDSHEDFAVANYNSSDVRVYVKDIHGNYVLHATITYPMSPRKVMTRDLNSDGKLDIVTALGDAWSTYPTWIVVHLADGNGGFNQSAMLEFPGAVAAMDFLDHNEDGNIDIVAVCTRGAESGALHYFEGNGDGTFGTRRTYTSPYSTTALAFATHLSVGDYNGDGKPDVAVSSNYGRSTGSDYVWIFLADNAGCGFIPAERYATGGGPAIGMAKDLNGDGKVDLASANSSTHDLTVLLNTYTPCESITMGSLSLSYHRGEEFTVSVTTSGFIRCDNVFQVELSDANGDFSNAVIIGSSQANSISASMPAMCGFGDGYRIRVVSTQPHVISADNGEDITVYRRPGDNYPPVISCRNVVLAVIENCKAHASIDNGTYDPDGDPVTLTQEPPGPYLVGSTLVTLTATDIYDAVSSCVAEVTVVGTEPVVTVISSPEFPVYPGGESNTIYLGYGTQSVTLTAAGADSWQWTPSHHLSCTDCASPIMTPIVEGSYTYTAVGTDAYGCSGSASITIDVVDVYGGSKKVLVCLQGHTLNVNVNAVDALLTHAGATLGACPTPKLTVAVDALSLGQNYPNPFNPITKIAYTLPESGAVLLTVYDLYGRAIERLVDARQEAGNWNVRFDGSRYPSGMYMYRLDWNGRTLLRQMLLLR